MSAVFGVCLAFLLGSFPSGVVLARLLGGRDIRRTGSGNIGAANVAREVGFKVGILVAALDILKGVVAVLVGKWMGLDPTALAAVALAAVLGHDFSVFLRFRGGKGVATTLGAALVLVPSATVPTVLVWLAMLAVRPYASLASLVALALLPIFIGVMGLPPAYVVLAFALFILAVAKHWKNIIRIVHGTESVLWRRTSDGR